MTWPDKICIGCGLRRPQGAFLDTYGRDGLALPDGDHSHSEPWHVGCTSAAHVAEKAHAAMREILRSHGIALTGDARHAGAKLPLARRRLQAELYARLTAGGALS